MFIKKLIFFLFNGLFKTPCILKLDLVHKNVKITRREEYF